MVPAPRGVRHPRGSGQAGPRPCRARVRPRRSGSNDRAPGSADPLAAHAAGSAQFTKGGNFIGTELDFFLRYQVLKDLTAVFAYGYLITGNYFEAPSAATVGVGSNPVTQKSDNMQVGLLELNYRF